ncbi:MAG: zinc-binding alcohol dehydrogenase family protein [Frankiales bacterium]|nr:zinc-binding alcohol dehydrogenase family protein [Frankiales bacterium]
MRALVLEEQGGAAHVRDTAAPEPADGCVLIDVTTAGLGAWDVVGAYRMPIGFPCVVRAEGVGRTQDGRRVYFGERSVRPHGGCAEQTLVPAEEVWDVPDDVDDRTAITLGIAGTGALLPMEHAAVQPGENVLVLGGTGALGRIALQLARHAGAARVVAAARRSGPLDALVAEGTADAGVVLRGDGDTEALREASGGGFDVVLDGVYGEPFSAALRATRPGARVVTVGTLAGPTALVPAGDLLFRTHTVQGTGQRTPDERREAWLRLLDLSRSGTVHVPGVTYPLEQGGQAWAAQVAGPHGKVFLDVAGAS